MQIFATQMEYASADENILGMCSFVRQEDAERNLGCAKSLIAMATIFRVSPIVAGISLFTQKAVATICH
jgi:hypothetical protein